MKKSLVSILAITVATPAFAQAGIQTAPAENAGEGEIVVTASRVVSEAREIGSAVTIVSQADLKRNQITFVKDILQDVPGVITTADRPGALTRVSIRGSRNDEVLWLTDGIELGDPSAISTQYQSDDLMSRDIARIEILRGNQSSLYGSDAIGGVINIVTQRATEDGFKVNGAAEAGSYGTLNGGATVLGKSGPLDFRLTATGYQHDGPSLADPATATGPTTEKDEYWQYGFSGRVGLQASDTLSFQAIGFWRDVFSDLDNTTSDSDDTVRRKEYAFAGQGNYASLDGKFKAKLTGSRYKARRLYFGTFNSPDGDVFRGTKDELSLDLSYGGDGVFTVAAGGNYERERTTQSTFFSGDFLAKVNTKSAYGEIALRPIEGLTLTGAARVDDNSRFGTFDTYRGTVAYVQGPVKLRGSYGTGAKAPGLYQLFDPTYGNPDLKAETSRGGDIGFDVAFAQGLTGEITYFFNKKRNEIVFDGSRPPFGGYAQFGRTKAQGIEIGIAATPASWLTLNQSLTYVDHEQDSDADGVYLDSGRPKYTVTTSVTVNPVERASIGARLRYHGGDASGFGGATQSYTVVDLLGSYGITDTIEVYGRVVNLFDEQYQVSYGTQTQGLSAFGGVRVSF